MSFRERGAWIALAAHALVFGGYFYALWQSWDERAGPGLSIGLMLGAVLAMIAIMATLAMISAIAAPKQANAPADERERMIELKAERSASFTLSMGVVLLIWALLMGWNGVLVANLLLAAMVASELVKALSQIIAFRRGA